MFLHVWIEKLLGFHNFLGVLFWAGVTLFFQWFRLSDELFLIVLLILFACLLSFAPFFIQGAMFFLWFVGSAGLCFAPKSTDLYKVVVYLGIDNFLLKVLLAISIFLLFDPIRVLQLLIGILIGFFLSRCLDL